MMYIKDITVENVYAFLEEEDIVYLENKKYVFDDIRESKYDKINGQKEYMIDRRVHITNLQLLKKHYDGVKTLIPRLVKKYESRYPKFVKYYKK